MFGFLKVWICKEKFKEFNLQNLKKDIWLLWKFKSIIEQLSKFIRKNVQDDQEELIVEEANELLFDKDKQQIAIFLKVHELVINLIVTGTDHFIYSFMQDTMPRKEELQQLFENAFSFLIYF